MAFVPANVVDANKRVFSLPDTDVSTNETGVALPVEITYADFPEFFDETAPDIHADTVLLIESFNEADGATDFEDSSPSGHTVTANGDTEHSTTQSKHSTSSIKLDGAGDYLSIADSDDWSMSADYTIRFWLFTGQTATVSIANQWDYNGTDSTVWPNSNFELYLDANKLYWRNSNGSSSTTLISTSNINSSSWVHVELCNDGGTLRMFIGGSPEDTDTAPTYATSTRPVWVGSSNDSTTYADFNGYIQGFQIIKGTALHTTGFTPPARLFSVPTYKRISAEQDGSQIPIEVSPNEWEHKVDSVDSSLIIRPNGIDGSTTFTDESANDHTITTTGVTNDDGQIKFQDTAILFESSNSDYLQVTEASELAPGSGDFWLEFWVYLNTRSGVVGFFSGSSSSEMWIALTAEGWFGIGQSSWDSYYGTALSTGSWHHLALGRSSGTGYWYQNGTRTHTATLSKTYALTDPYIGRTLGGSYLDGYIDELIYKVGVCDHTEASFQVPSSPYNSKKAVLYIPVDANTATGAEVTISADGTQDDNVASWVDNTVLLIESRNAADGSTTFTDTSNSGHTVTAVSDAEHSTDYGILSDSSLGMPTTDDCLSVPDSTDFDLGTGDYTIRGWFYLNDISIQRYIFSSAATWVSVHAFTLRVESSAGAIRYLAGDSIPVDITSANGVISAITLHHFAVCCVSGVTTLYIDGTSVGTDSSNPSIASASTLYIGSDNLGDTAFGGYMQGFQIIKGTALHTSNFTPPTRLVSKDAGVGITGELPAKACYDSNFKAVYHMAQDPSGGADCILDSTGSYDLTPTNMDATNLVSAGIGMGLEFNGADEWVLNDSFSGVITDYPLTLIQVVKTDSAGTLQYLGGVSNGGAYNLWLSAGFQNTNAMISHRDSGGLIRLDGPTVIGTDDYYVVITSFESDTSKKLYLDGSYETAITATEPIPSGINRIMFGAAPDFTPSDEFNGICQEYRICTSVLSTTEITLISKAFLGTLWTVSAYESAPTNPYQFDLTIAARSETLTDFPVTVPLGSATGLTDFDTTAVFGAYTLGQDELPSLEPIAHYTMDTLGILPTNHYTMDNITGSTLTDEMGNADGTITNRSQTTSGWDGDYLAGGDLDTATRNVDLGANIPFKSLSMWFRRIETGAGSYDYIFDLVSDNACAVNGSNNLLSVYNSGFQNTNLSVTDTDWHHLAVVEGATNNSHWLYLDGVKASSALNTGFAGVFRYLGRVGTASGQNVSDLDNVQVYDQVLTDDQITELYNATSQDFYPTSDGTNDNAVVDEKGTYPGFITNMTQTAGGKFGYYLAGGDITSTVRNVDFTSISFKSASLWVKKIDASTSSHRAFLDASYRGVYLGAGTGELFAYDGSGNNSYNLTITDNTTWHHLVITEGTTNNSHWVWVDGVKSSTEETTNLGGVFRYLGRPGTAVGAAPDFDNIQIFDQVLTDAQIRDLYLVERQTFQTNMIHPDTVLLIESNDTDGATEFFDLSDSAHQLTTSGDPDHSTDQTKFSKTMIHLDGNDYISAAAHTDFDLGVGAFTIQGWICPSSLPFTWILISGNSSGDFFIGGTQTQFQIGRHNVAIDQQYAHGMVINNIYHFAVIRESGGLTTFYIGGSSIGSASNTHDYDFNTLYVGYGNGYYSNGYIQGIQIIKGTALHTTDFVPPICLPSSPDYRKLIFKQDETQLFSEVDVWETYDETDLKAVIQTKANLGTSETVLTCNYDPANEDQSSKIGIVQSAAAKAVWNSAYVARYSMSQDPAMSDILDSTGNYDGAVTGTASTISLVDGTIGKGLDYTSSAYHLTSAIDITEDITLEALHEPDVDSDDTLIAIGTTDYNAVLLVSDISTGPYTTVASDDGSTWDSTGKIVTLDVLNYSYGKYDGTTWYADIDSSGSPDSVVSGAPRYGTKAMKIGAHYSGATYNYDGTIYEVRISNIARSAEWLVATNDTLTDAIIVFTQSLVPPVIPPEEEFIGYVKPLAMFQGFINRYASNIMFPSQAQVNKYMLPKYTNFSGGGS